MGVFLSLFTAIVPLYILIAIGYAGGRFLNIDRLSLANLVVFICVPVVMFGYVAQLEFQMSYLLLPILTYCGIGFISFVFLALGRRIYGDSRANILALLTGPQNSGYFGLPVVLFIFDTQQVAIYMFMILGGVLFEATFGYYIAARGAFDPKESVRRLLMFPSLYAFPLALIVNFADITLPDLFLTYWGYFKGAYVVLGMMIIGSALSGMKHFEFSLRFNALMFLGKFLCWPALALVLIVLDKAVFGFYGDGIHMMILLFSILPPAANVTAFATQFNTNPEKAATTVLAGTVLALFLIPAVVWLVGF